MARRARRCAHEAAVGEEACLSRRLAANANGPNKIVGAHGPASAQVEATKAADGNGIEERAWLYAGVGYRIDDCEELIGHLCRP